MSQSTKTTSSPIVGIDFGTTKTMVAVYDLGRNHARTQRLGRGRDELPTAMFTTASGEVLFGDEAEDEGESDQVNLMRRFKMKLGHPGPAIVGRRKATAEELVADFLRYLKMRLESEVLHEQVQRAVLTVPAMFGPAQRKSLMNAAKTAGFLDVTLLDEPTAAGLAYCDHNPVGKDLRFLVVDWGGGTFDVALLERSADRGTKIIREFVAGLGDIGGETLDDDLWGHVSQSLVDAGYERLDRQDRNMWGRYRREISRSKERLSNIDSVKVNFLLNGGNPVRIDFQRSVLEDAISANVVKGANFVAELLDRCRAVGQMPDFVLLAGGTSRIPMIQRVFEERLQIECRKWSEGREAIALGAALHARDLWQPKESPNESKEKTAHNGKMEAMSIYRGLLEAAWADGMISQEEWVFLGKRRKELGLSIEESEIIQRQVLGALIRDIAENETTSSTNYSARKFNCPNRQCGKEMVLTPVEYASKTYACPYCKKSGFISRQQTANVAQTEHYAADGQQVMGQSGSGLEEGYYDVVLADSGRNKIAVIKALCEVIPAVGLARARNIVESTPYKIADDASSQSSEEIKRHLEEAGASVRLFRKLSIQSSEMEVASNANVSCHELSVDAMKLPTPVDSSSREVSTRVSSGSLIHRDKVLKLIGRFTSGTPDDSTYVWPKLPPQKIKNAIASYAKVNSSEILLLHDSTVFGSAKDGFIMTSTHIFWKDMNEQPRSIRFSEVSTIIENASTTFIGSGLQINGIPFTPNGGFYNKSLCSMFRKLILAICAINLGN
jgi:ribosomal protein L7/L12